ncbi:hypothetical protein V2J09_015664 [Rumex salicifolius]
MGDVLGRKKDYKCKAQGSWVEKTLVDLFVVVLDSKECLKSDAKPLRLIISTMLTGFSLLMKDIPVDERSCWFQTLMNDFVNAIKNFKLQDVDLTPRVDIIDNSSNATIEAKYENITGDLSACEYDV